tara:strand:- start:116 stop:598 length:483 start_codon:yes stop_codon:yes gene_type:complete
MSVVLYQPQVNSEDEYDESIDELYKCTLCGNIWDGNAQCVCGMLDDEPEYNNDSDTNNDSGIDDNSSVNDDLDEELDNINGGYYIMNTSTPSPDNSIPIEEDQSIEHYYKNTHLETISSYNFSLEETTVFVAKLKEGFCSEDAIDEIRLMRLRQFSKICY